MFRLYVYFFILGFTLSGCSGKVSTSERRLVIYAASSLTDVFGKLKRGFEASHPGLFVDIAFAGSQTLRLQIEQGAPADLFVSANQDHLARLEEQGQIQERRALAYNQLALIVPRGNPAAIGGVKDLENSKRLIMGNEAVPIGQYTRRALEKWEQQVGKGFKSRVLSRVVSMENNVRLLRAKVELGEADAAIVYRTDALGSEHLEHIPIAPEDNLRTVYHMGVISKAMDSQVRRAWLDYLDSPAATELLLKEGLELP